MSSRATDQASSETIYRKYPSTPHLPWSPGASADDVWVDTIAQFDGREVVVTEKMDGENTTMYRDHMHARSLDSRHHPSRSWVKALHSQIAHLIPAGWRVCGENLYARHSIAYEGLTSYFVVFSIWDERNVCLSWADTVEWAALLGLEVAPVLWSGVWDARALMQLADELDLTRQEGYVVRDADAFAFEDFTTHIAKWVRPDHVQTDQHWMHGPIIPNGLASDDHAPAS